MVAPNISKRYCWMYETTAGTTLLDIATDTTYYFGIYNDEVNKWNYPKIENKITDYHTYNSRNPTSVNAGSTMPVFTHTYIPTSAQHLVWQKGKCTDAAPDTFAAAAYNKQQYAISLRAENYDGTNESFFQLNGCFSVKLYGVIQAGSPYTVETTWEYMNYEDIGDGKARLTTAPVVPDTSSTPYVGLPTVVYDYGGTAYTIPNVIKFDYTDTAIYSKAYTNATESAQVVYKERFKPVTFSITAAFQVNTMWDDYIDRTGTKEIRVTLFKADATEYIILDLTNVRIITIEQEGEGFEGYYTSTLIGQADALSGSFTGQGTFATHFKGETT